LSNNSINSRYGLAFAVTGKSYLFNSNLILVLVDSFFAHGVTSSGSLLVDVNESGSNGSIDLFRRRLEGSVGKIRSKFVNSHTKCVSKIIGSIWNEYTH
jgi:hypothetical protein